MTKQNDTDISEQDIVVIDGKKYILYDKYEELEFAYKVERNHSEWLERTR